MLEVFDSPLYTRLQDYIVREAKSRIDRRETAPRSYELIVEDYNQGQNQVYHLLRLLPPAVIRSLICNTLPFDIIHGPEVRKFFDAHMVIKEASPCAGIYVQWIASAPTSSVTEQGADREGKFLSSNQVARMLNLVEGYLDNQPASQAVNDSIDRTYNPNWQSGKARERGKVIKDETERNVREWVDTVRRQYCTNIDPAKIHDAFLRVPMEVGWAEDVPKRINQHSMAAATPALLYLVNAIMRKEFGGTAGMIKQEALLFPCPTRSTRLCMRLPRS